MNNGLTLVEVFPEAFLSVGWSCIHFVISLIMDIPIARWIYDMRFDQYHLTSKPGGIYTSPWQKLKGVWNKMPLESKDHLAFMGCGEDYEMYGAFMTTVALRMLNLPTVDAEDAQGINNR